MYIYKEKNKTCGLHDAHYFNTLKYDEYQVHLYVIFSSLSLSLIYMEDHIAIYVSYELG